ncbi:hypothetical protein BT93_F3363 [Corymbia citriodora subsp. variegata]|nr:hypothetical protein BT93_F3363 [Corymbia citriodora subsp. variegata]
MGRAKLKLELIPNARSRRVTFEKRKKGLMKKAEEFKILCGVDTCVIIDPMGMSSDRQVEPETWPDRKEVERIICRYQSEAADCRAKHATGLREFFTSQKKKIDAELAKARRANWEAIYPVSVEVLKDLSEPQLRSVLSAVGDRLEKEKTWLATTKEKRRAEMEAPSDWSGVDLHASKAGFQQDRVVEAGLPSNFLYQQDKEKTLVEMAAPGDWIVPKGRVDLHASNAVLMQDGVVEARLPFEFLYQEDKEKRMVEMAAPCDWIVPSGGVDLYTSNAGYMPDAVVKDGLLFEFPCQQDKEKRRVEMVASSDLIAPNGGVDLYASNAGYMPDGVVEAGLPFEYFYQPDSSVGSIHDYPSH